MMKEQNKHSENTTPNGCGLQGNIYHHVIENQKEKDNLL